MIRRQYKKESWYGRIYHWYHGEWYQHNNDHTTTCSIRRTLLLAPFAFVWRLFKKIIKFEPFRGIPIWALTVAALQIYLWSIRGQYPRGGDDLLAKYLGEHESVMRAVWLYIGFTVNDILTVIEAIALSFIATNELLKKAEKRVAKSESIQIDLTPVKDWIDDVYHKICKPVEWVNGEESREESRPE